MLTRRLARLVPLSSEEEATLAELQAPVRPVATASRLARYAAVAASACSSVATFSPR